MQQILSDVKLGKGAKIYDFINLYGCETADGNKISAFFEIQKVVRDGKSCKISRHAYHLMRENKGEPGVEGITFKTIGGMKGGEERYLKNVAEELRNKTYKSTPI